MLHQVTKASLALIVHTLILANFGATGKQANYWVTFSDDIRPGSLVDVNVHLEEHVQPTNIHVSLRNDSDGSKLSEAQARADGSGDYIIKLPIPPRLKNPDYGKKYYTYSIRVETNIFNKSATVTLYEKPFSVFIQTDKAIYKPGQQVHVRALAMKPDLKILKVPMDVIIRDPKGNGIKQWHGVEGVSKTGVIQLSMPISNYPPLGDWSIEVTALGYTETKTFTVDKYVLPKFEVELDVPNYLLTKDSLRGTASAKYVFGKSLTSGVVFVTLKFDYYYSENDKPQPYLTKQGKLDSNGEMIFTFTNQELSELAWKSFYNYKEAKRKDLSLDYRSVTVAVNVTDTGTGQTMVAEASVSFRSKRTRIDFLPISATNYKPGLKYTSHVSVLKFNGEPFEDYSSIKVLFKATINEPTASDLIENLNKKVDPGNGEQILPPQSSSKGVVVGKQSVTLSSNGILSFELTIPKVAKSVYLEVSALDETAYDYLSKAESPSDNFLQIELLSTNPKVGELAKFSVTTTELVYELTYQIYAKGIMLSSKVISLSAGKKYITFSVPVVANMAPNCRVLSFYLRKEGEVVVDSLSFKVDMISENPLSLTFSKEKVKPGAKVDIKIRAKPDSFVFMLAVDKSVQLLKSGNDITPEKVTEELISYDYGSGNHYFWPYMETFFWPFPSLGVDAYSIFRDANVAILTDGTVFRSPPRSFFADGTAMSKVMESSSGRGPVESVPVERVRTFFPETWLWKLVLIGSEGQVIWPAVAPDTITTWWTTAFSIHPTYGLSVLPKPSELTTFKDIFLSLDMPYSAIHNEILCMKAFAFNYYSQPLQVTMTMGHSEGIEFISNVLPVLAGKTNEISSDSHKTKGKKPLNLIHDLKTVKPNTLKETLFCFMPTILGQISIEVNLTTLTIPGDGVIQMLLVEPEGLLRTETIPTVLDVKKGKPLVKKIPIKFPADRVVGSERIVVSLAGDLLGPVFKNIANLLRMPYGCGEQNMMYFAPDVFLMKFLQKTQTYTKELAATAVYYMLTGYQKELTYQHDDGSYSAFGQTTPPTNGSMWLTAFVTKCFVQSKSLPEEMIDIDATVIQRSLKWIISQQQSSGAFPEPGVTYDKNIQGGSAQGTALTAYVMIALAEADLNVKELSLSAKDNSKLQSALSKGRIYLENKLSNLTDSYDISIVTYALHLVNSSKAKVAYDLLREKAIVDELAIHWERPKPKDQGTSYPWELSTDAISIEATSYALLTYMYLKNKPESLLIVRWLTNQRGSEGGFISTQDTVIGLQALAEAAAFFYKPILAPIKLNLNYDIGDEHKLHVLSIDDSNKLLLQEFEILPEHGVMPLEVTLTATTTAEFSGIALASLSLFYHVKAPTNFPTFYLPTPKVIVTGLFSIKVVIEFSRKDGHVGGMTVLEVTLPTGYSVNDNNPDYSVIGSKLTEAEDRKYILYYEKIGKDGYKVVLPMTVTSGIPVKVGPTPIKLYDYYNRGGNQEATTSYQLKPLNSTSVCHIAPGMEGC